MPNGRVLLATSPDTFGTPTHIQEFDGTNLILVPAPNRAPLNPSFVYRFLQLPNGQVMSTDGSTDVEFYTPLPGVVAAAAPTIVTAPAFLKPGQSYTLTGTQLNGLSQANAYGDDVQNATNYPTLQIINNASSHVQFARTHDHSTMGIATGSTIVTTLFDVPANAETGPCELKVITNGIPSLTKSATICAPSVVNNVSASPNSLWPPNHSYVDVAINYDTSTSTCPSNCALTVASNETSNNSEFVIVDAHHLKLLAERDGNGTGRVYTITITCTNPVGDVTIKTTTVVVPHDQGQ